MYSILPYDVPDTPQRKRHKTCGDDAATDKQASDTDGCRKRHKTQDDTPSKSPELKKSVNTAWGQIVLVSQGTTMLPAMVRMMLSYIIAECLVFHLFIACLNHSYIMNIIHFCNHC